ncbi:cleavage and polyadenylation specificity factor subunit 4 [Microdochium nivale]|nr:cleavage and polyadenylation specificity factor subunit 4 [Microdochium nivale]
MPSPEDEQLMAKISELSGKINRHKARNTPGTKPTASYSRYTPYPARGYPRGGYRPQPTYRNKTLVLNGQPQLSTPNRASDSSGAPSPASSWVTKTDRHLQLINSSVFEKETQNRSNAIEETLRQKQINRDNREKARLANHTQRMGRPALHASPTSSSTTSRYEIEVEGIRFVVSRGGDKLVKAQGDINPPSATPKTTHIGGVKFYRTKNGNLVRHGVIRAKQMAGGVKKVNEQCKAFSWNGSCPKGANCRYLHDASKVAICRNWLLKGECPNGDNCDLFHELTEERTPLCLHFAKGKCSKPDCSYVHTEHAASDPVCRAFGSCGYCANGARCPDRHVFECPDFSNNGVCKVKGCKRRHIERASMLRKRQRGSSEEMGDLTSDDDDFAADSDDYDSDEVEEFIGKDAIDDVSFIDQKDFIGF